MEKKVFKASLSVSSIDNLMKQIEDYKNSLEYKCQLYVEKLVSLGEEIANVKISDSPLGKYITVSSNLSIETSGCKAILVAVGEVKQSEGFDPFNTLLAVEFGAGIYHNKIANPKSDKFGLGVGTFPNQIHAFEDGWYYFGNDEQWHYTHGVRATMPMFNASTEIINNYIRIAREVFGSG